MGVSVVVYPLLSPPQRKFAFVLNRQLFIVKCFKGILFLSFNCCTEAYHTATIVGRMLKGFVVKLSLVSTLHEFH